MSSPISLVVIIATNGRRSEFLVRCLQSLQDQESQADAVICASSTPNLPAAALEFAQVVVDRIGGASSAKNLALAAIQSELVAFLDDDCVADRRWLRLLRERFNHHGPELAGVTGGVLPTREGLYLVRSEPHSTQRTFASLSESVPPWNIGGGLNMCFRRRVLLEVGGFDSRLGPGSRFRSAEELDLFCRILARGYEIEYDPAALVYHEPLDTFPQVVRTRYSYRVGLGAFFAKNRQDPLQRRIFRNFLSTELHDAKTSVSRLQPGQAVLSAFGLLGLFLGRALGTPYFSNPTAEVLR